MNATIRPFRRLPAIGVLLACAAFAAAEDGPPVVRSWGVPSGEPQGVEGECSVRVADAFRALHPEARRPRSCRSRATSRRTRCT